MTLLCVIKERRVNLRDFTGKIITTTLESTPHPKDRENDLRCIVMCVREWAARNFPDILVFQARAVRQSVFEEDEESFSSL